MEQNINTDRVPATFSEQCPDVVRGEVRSRKFQSTQSATILSRVLRKCSIWFRLQRLAWELRCSRKFQRECEANKCFILAELEQAYQREIRQKIKQLMEVSSQS